MSARYSARYRGQDPVHLYPVEFVVRAFLGTYPKLRMHDARYAGARVLDLGYGDGRNMPLLRNLGFKLHGVEITEAINEVARARLRRLGIRAVLKVGRNASLPWKDAYFDYVLACHSCYYVDEGTSFRDNLREIHRVMRPEGRFICSLPLTTTYILEGAQRLAGGHFRIRHDPFGIREGVVFRAFAGEKEIRDELGPFFKDFRIGRCDDDYWGIRQKVWIVVCTKR